LVSIARGSLVRWTLAVMLGAALAAGSMDVAPSRAEAQCAAGAMGCSPVQALPKATVGLGLIGAELGLIIPAIAGVRDEWWPYLVFPVIGAAGGAVGGYFLDEAMQSGNTPEVSVVIMAIGMALVVPAVIGTLALTAYSPPADSSGADEDMDYEEQSDSVEAVQDDTSAAPAEGEATSDPQASLQQRIHALYAGGPGLLRFHQGQLLLAAPLVASVGTFTGEEIERLHLQQQTDVVLPLVSASF
jgi:hypothetical protein